MGRVKDGKGKATDNRPGFRMDGISATPLSKKQILSPTNDRRHMPSIREGKMSAEVFARDKDKRLYPPFPSRAVPE